VAELFAYLLARDGWTVTTCLDGKRGADALGGRTPCEAVVVSNGLHGIRGRADHADSRARSPHDVPIVMVTGTLDCALVAGALAAGADDVLYEPVDVVILVDTVNKCIERVRRRRE
jgi:DNA-binding response OmpR family regulator